MDAREAYLAHHGILGQKWGRKNGPPYPLDAQDHSASEKRAGWRKSLDGGSAIRIGRVKKTPFKKVKSSPQKPSDEEMKSYIQKRNLEKTYTKLKKEETSDNRLNDAKTAFDRSADLSRQINNILRENTRKKASRNADYSSLSDKEMRDAINRYSLELQYSRMMQDQSMVNSGRARVSEMLETAGTVATAAGSALGIAVAIKELRK